MKKEVVNVFRGNEKNLSTKEKIVAVFDSIKSFCVYHNIEYGSFCSLLNRYPHVSLESLLQYYRKTNSNLSRSECIVSGVSLQGICLRYQLDYCAFLDSLKAGVPFDEALISAILNTPFFVKTYVSKLKELTPLVQNLNLNDLEKTLNVLQCDPDLIDNILLYYSQYHKVKDALNAYYIVDFIENGWEDFYSKEIQDIYQKNNQVDAYHQYQILKNAVRGEVLSRFGLKEKDIREYYEEFYSDFLKVHSKEGTTIWTYNRKKILIPNRKKDEHNLSEVSK